MRDLDFKMNERFKIGGYWWLPENEKEKIYGELTYEPDEPLKLDLKGTFIKDRKITIPPKTPHRYDFVYGVGEGSIFTLYNCVETLTNIFLPGTINSRICASVLFVNAYFKQPSEIKFKSISISLSYLGEWLGLKPFNVITDGKEVNIRYKYYDEVKYKINENLDLIIFYTSSESLIPVSPRTEIHIKHIPFIKINSKNEETFEDFFYQKIFQIRNFLTLMIRYPVTFLYIFGENGFIKYKSKEKEYYTPIFILFPNQQIHQKAPSTIIPEDMNFKFSDIKSEIGQILNNWFAGDEELSRVNDFYFGTIYNPTMYPENKFLNLVIALEGYHRIIFGNKIFSDKEYKEMVDKIIDSVPQDYKDWLKEKLEYGNEPSLGKRLIDIFDKFRGVLTKYFPSKKYFKRFKKRVVDTRNNLVHIDKNGDKDYAKTPQEFRELNRKLRIIIEVCLLNRIGFSNTKIKELIDRLRI